jgi:hypothetical protein
MGKAVQSDFCHLCGENRIYLTQKKGFEGAHVISQKWIQREQVNVFYAFPSCSACNNACRDCCILDYLYQRGRIQQLRKMIMVIFEHFLQVHSRDLGLEYRFAPLVLRYLYGQQKWGAGGMVNEKEICEIARAEQQEALSRHIVSLCKQVQECSTLSRMLSELPIQTMKL